MKRGTLLLLLALLAGCANNKDPVKPNPDTEHPPEPAYTFIYGDTLNATAQCPQVDIPWPSLANSPWPMAIVNQQGLSRAPDIGMPTLNKVWQYPDNINVYGGAPIDYGVAIGPGGTIYFTDTGRKLTALSSDGKKIWELGEPYSMERGPSIGADSTIYCSTDGNGLLAITPQGTVKWKALDGYWIPDHCSA